MLPLDIQMQIELSAQAHHREIQSVADTIAIAKSKLGELPPLPMGDDYEYTPEEMREYALLAVKLERERCARVCEERAGPIDARDPNPYSQEAADCAAAIRGA